MLENFKYLPPEEKKRLAYIEDRPELFETKVLKIVTNEHDEGQRKNILITARDPGSANALLPVLQELAHDAGVEITAVTDGRGEEILEHNFQTQDITPQHGALAADAALETPDVILIDLSSEMGIDHYMAATFLEVPRIYVEGAYTGTQHFLSNLKERKLPFPDKLCVIDQAEKDLILQKFPELHERVEVTGQPAFDKFAVEDTERISREVKEKLGLKSTDKLVSFMSTMDETEKIKKMAEALKKVGDKFTFVFRRHPRDSVSYETYKKILTDAGIKMVDTDSFSTNDIGAASDVVLTSWSTEGLHGMYRRKPTVHILDTQFRLPPGMDLPMVPVRLGASVGLDDMGKLDEVLPELLNPESPLNTSLRQHMESYYPADGKNTLRVANIVRQYLKTTKE